MPTSLVYTLAKDGYWYVFESNAQAILFRSNKFTYDLTPMVTGIFDYVCEYTYAANSTNLEMSRILFFHSPVAAQPITLGTLFVSIKYVGTEMPQATLDLQANYEQLKISALINAQAHIPTLLMTNGAPAYHLFTALDQARINMPQLCLPAAQPPPLPIRPIEPIPQVSNTANTTQQTPNLIPPVTNPLLSENIQLKQEIADIRSDLHKVQEKVTQISDSNSETISFPQEYSDQSSLKSFGQSFKDDDSDAETDYTSVSTPINRNPEPRTAANKKKKKKKNKNKAFDLNTIYPSKNNLTWIYQRSVDFIENLDAQTKQKIHLGLTVFCLQWTIFRLAEYNGIINSQELFDDSRSRLTFNTLATIFLALLATLGYLKTQHVFADNNKLKI